MIRYFDYYYVGGTFLGTLKKVQRIGVNTYDAFAFYGYWDGKMNRAQWTASMVEGFKKAQSLGFKHAVLRLACQLPSELKQSSIMSTLGAVAPFWPMVKYVEAADEPSWTRQETKANLEKVRGIISSMHLELRPVGITYTTDQSLSGDCITIPPPSAGGRGPDFVGLEAYCDRTKKPMDQGDAKNVAFVKTSLKKALARIHPLMRVAITLQGFDRNGAFLREEGLVALNTAGYDVARSDPRVDYLSVFNWGRESLDRNGNHIGGGTRWYPKLQAEHARIAKELKLA